MLRKSVACLVLALAFLMCAAAPALAADWYVAQTIGSDLNDGTSPVSAFGSITRGMEAASAGDVVHVLVGATGLYNETITGEVFPIEMASGVVLQGDGSAAVTIQGNGSDPVISGTAVDASATVDGFTVTGGRPGMLFDGSSLTVSNNEITGNTGPGYMGAGIHTSAGSLRIVGNTISGNSAEAFGGGINAELSDTSYIADNDIANNTASGGGGIECYYRSSPTIVGNRIVGNSASSGAGILLESAGGSIPQLRENVITGNTATEMGGAVYLYSSSGVFVNCLIAGNSAPTGSAFAGLNSGSTQLVNCTVSDNTGSVAAVALASTSWPFSIAVRNSIVEGLIGDGVIADVTYSDVEGGYEGIGNIDADPLFVERGADYRLADGSPCIDAGTDEPLAPTDLDGVARPYGTGWDMGAYEWCSTDPVADAGGPYAAVEDDPILLDGAASAGDGIASWLWDLDGDGEFDDAQGEQAWYTYADDHHGEVRLMVVDADGASSVGTASVDVSNAAPVLDALAAPTEPVLSSEPVEVSAAFTDAGTADVHSASIDWGDGTVTDATIMEQDGSGTAAGAHAYASAGVFTVTMTLVDDDGGMSSPSTATVEVYEGTGHAGKGQGQPDPPGLRDARPGRKPE